MEKIFKQFAVITCIVALCLFSCIGSYNRGLKRGKSEQYAEDIKALKPDTTFVHDTVLFSHPVPTLVEVVDTFYVASVDTIRLRDTVLCALPFERKIYEDTLYRATVSGCSPSLEQIEIFQGTKVITTTVNVPVVQHNRIGVDISVLCDSGFRFPVTLGYEHIWGSGFRLGANCGYDPLTQSPIMGFRGGWSFQW